MTEPNRKVDALWLGATALFAELALNLLPILGVLEYFDVNSVSYALASVTLSGLNVAVIAWMIFRRGGTGWMTWLIPGVLLAIGFVRQAIIFEIAGPGRIPHSGLFVILATAQDNLTVAGILFAEAILLNLLLGGRTPPEFLPTSTLLRLGCLMAIFALVLAIRNALKLGTTIYTSVSVAYIEALWFGNVVVSWDRSLVASVVLVAAVYPIQSFRKGVLQRVLVFITGVLLIAGLIEIDMQLFLNARNELGTDWLSQETLASFFKSATVAVVMLTTEMLALWFIYIAGYRWHVQPSKSEKILSSEGFSLDLLNSEAKTSNDEKLY